MPSAAIRDFSYNVATRQLTVTFTTGKIYVYAQVPPDVHNAFRATASRGRFFNQEIRDNYECRELTSSGNAPLNMARDHRTGWRR